ncbi:MAG: RNA polymerase sigma factor [Deltaproteobacteria bacterium]|nr:RNA polymerase sigma factor [Deltaproteobacteria bacterium]
MSDHQHVIAKLYRQHCGELSRFLARHVGCRELAADLLHELFLRLLSSGQAITEIRYQRGYLFRCARNLATEAASSPRWRAKQQDASALLTQEEDWLCPERKTADKQTLDRLLITVMHLPPRCRDAFILHKFDGFTYAEVANHMGISVGAVEKHISRALDACRSATRRDAAESWPTKK